MKIRYKLLMVISIFTAVLYLFPKYSGVFAKEISVTETQPPVVGEEECDEENPENDCEKNYGEDIEAPKGNENVIIIDGKDKDEMYRQLQLESKYIQLSEFYAKEYIVLDKECYMKSGQPINCLVYTQDYFDHFVSDAISGQKDFWVSNGNSIAGYLKSLFNALQNNGVINSDGSLNSSFVGDIQDIFDEFENAIQNGETTESPQDEKEITEEYPEQQNNNSDNNE